MSEEVKTDVVGSRFIRQRFDHPDYGWLERLTLDTHDTQVKDALVELGWTPPKNGQEKK